MKFFKRLFKLWFTYAKITWCAYYMSDMFYCAAQKEYVASTEGPSKANSEYKLTFVWKEIIDKIKAAIELIDATNKAGQ